MGEQWCGDPNNTLAPPQRSEIEWAREFRYDGARARYLNRPLQPAPLENATPRVQDLSPAGQFVETIYDGDQPYADRVGQLWQRLFVPGVGRVEPFSQVDPPNGGDNTEYYHSDNLGTMRTMTDPAGAGIDHNGGFTGVDTVYTAFGELVVNTLADGDANRYGYVGGHGYQAHDQMPFLHVGHRYYDPASGRFLQRDPIGVFGGTNVYAYGANGPTINVDPDGLSAGASDMGRFWAYLARGRLKDAEAILDSLAQLEGRTKSVRRMQQALKAAKAEKKWFKKWTKKGGKTRTEREEQLKKLEKTLKDHRKKLKDHPDSEEIARLEWQVRVLKNVLGCGG